MIKKIQQYANFDVYETEFGTAKGSSIRSSIRSSSSSVSERVRLPDMNRVYLTFFDRSLELEFLHSFYGKGVFWRLGLANIVASFAFFQYIFSCDLPYPYFLVTDVIFAITFAMLGIPAFLPKYYPNLGKSHKFKLIYETVVCVNSVLCLMNVVVRDAYHQATGSTLLFQFGFMICLRVRSICNFYMFIMVVAFAPFARLVFNLVITPYKMIRFLGLVEPQWIIFQSFTIVFINVFLYFGLYGIEKFQRSEFLKALELGRRKKNLIKEKRFTQYLLFNIVPNNLIDEVKKTNAPFITRQFDWGVCVEADFVDFTKSCKGLSSELIMRSINRYFTEFDILTKKLHGTKVKSAGCKDVYPVLFAIGQVLIVKRLRNENKDCNFSIRVGVAGGNLLLCVSCKRYFSFDCYGDAMDRSQVLEEECPHNGVNVCSKVGENTKTFFKYKHREKDYSYILSVENEGENVVTNEEKRKFLMKSFCSVVVGDDEDDEDENQSPLK